MIEDIAEQDGMRRSLTVVVPVFNEAESLPELYRRLAEILPTLHLEFEVILVDDGSKDRTAELIAEIITKDEHFRSIHFSRNFGHQAAVTAGVSYARGDAVVIMDADLQDPPELLHELIAKWREGYHVVYAQRMSRQRETWFKRGTAWIFYRLLSRLSDVNIPPDTGDFCLMDRRIVQRLNALPERNRYIRGLRAWLGFRQTAVPFERPARHAGDVKYTFSKSLALAINGLVSFSKVPLRLATYLGLSVAALSFLLGVWFIIEKVFIGTPTRGWASTIVVVLFLGGVQLLTIGIIGEYLSRIYDEVKQRPSFVVAQTLGFSSNHALVRAENPNIYG